MELESLSESVVGETLCNSLFFLWWVLLGADRNTKISNFLKESNAKNPTLGHYPSQRRNPIEQRERGNEMEKETYQRWGLLGRAAEHLALPSSGVGHQSICKTPKKKKHQEQKTKTSINFGSREKERKNEWPIYISPPKPYLSICWSDSMKNNSNIYAYAYA